MNFLQTYAICRCGLGKVDAAAYSLSKATGDVARFSLLLLGARMLMPQDLLVCKMLLGRCSSATELEAETLEYLLTMLCVSVNAGHSFLPLDRALLCSLIEQTVADALLALRENSDQTNDLIAWASPDTISRIGKTIGTQGALVLRAPAAKPVVGSVVVYDQSAQALYFSTYYHAEVTCARLLHQRLYVPEDPASPAECNTVLDRILTIAPPHTGTGCALIFDDMQIAAISGALQQSTTLICGGPGSGKTAVASQILRALALGSSEPLTIDDIRIAAPSGRAAARVQESLHAMISSIAPEQMGPAENLLLQVRAVTVHALLGYLPSTATFRHGPQLLLDAKIVVVDEVSMLDVRVFATLLGALHPATVLVLLGDVHQLPSVDVGSVLSSVADLARSYPQTLGQRVITLQRNHRANSSIDAIARTINSAREQPAHIGAALQTVSIVDSAIPELDSTVLRCTDDPRAAVRAWTTSMYGAAYQRALARAFAELARIQQRNPLALPADIGTDPGVASVLLELTGFLNGSTILCLMHATDSGVEQANAEAALVLNLGRAPEGTGGFFQGCPVMSTRNLPGIGIFNGDRGVVVQTRDQQFVCFARHQGVVLVPLHLIEGLTRCLAMTVHKSQGSEFDNVLLLLGEGQGPLLRREMLYTALTRAKKRVVICASADQIDKAIENRFLRRCGVAQRIAALQAAAL